MHLVHCNRFTAIYEGITCRISIILSLVSITMTFSLSGRQICFPWIGWASGRQWAIIKPLLRTIWVTISPTPWMVRMTLLPTQTQPEVLHLLKHKQLLSCKTNTEDALLEWKQTTWKSLSPPSGPLLSLDMNVNVGWTMSRMASRVRVRHKSSLKL